MILFSLYLVLAAVLSNILRTRCWLVLVVWEELWAGSSKENVIGNMKYNKMANGKNGRYRNKLFGAIYTHRREICRNIVENYIFIHLNTIWQWAMNKTIILTRTVFFHGDVSFRLWNISADCVFQCISMWSMRKFKTIRGFRMFYF